MKNVELSAKLCVNSNKNRHFLFIFCTFRRLFSLKKLRAWKQVLTFFYVLTHFSTHNTYIRTLKHYYLLNYCKHTVRAQIMHEKHKLFTQILRATVQIMRLNYALCAKKSNYALESLEGLIFVYHNVYIIRILTMSNAEEWMLIEVKPNSAFISQH